MSSTTTTPNTPNTPNTHQMQPVPEAGEIGVCLNPYSNGKPTARAVPDLRTPSTIRPVAWTGQVLKKFKSLTNELIGADSDATTFPGAHVVSLTRKALYDTLAKRSYYVCEKTDGVRYLLLCANGECFLIDRKDRYTWVKLFLPRGLPGPPGSKITRSSLLTNTLLDGELVVDHVKQRDGTVKKQLVFYIFDVMAVQRSPEQKPCDCSVVSLPLPDRLRLLHSHVLGPRHQWYQQSHWRHLFSNELRQTNGTFQVQAKNMYRAEDTRHVFESVLPNLPHKQDGLIYTPVNKRYTIGTDHSLIKWKPLSKNSGDFFLDSMIIEGDKCYFLTVGATTDHGTYEQMRVDWVTLLEEERVALDIHGRVLVEAVWNKDRPTTTVIEEGRRLRLGRVRVGGWEIKKTRADKESSNDIKAYKKIKESIKDNVLKHDLIDALSEKVSTEPLSKRRKVDTTSDF